MHTLFSFIIVNYFSIVSSVDQSDDVCDTQVLQLQYMTGIQIKYSFGISAISKYTGIQTDIVIFQTMPSPVGQQR